MNDMNETAVAVLNLIVANKDKMKLSNIPARARRLKSLRHLHFLVRLQPTGTGPGSRVSW